MNGSRNLAWLLLLSVGGGFITLHNAAGAGLPIGETQIRELRLVPVQSFGSFDADPNDRPADARVLGQIVKALESASGTLFVLDAIARKIVVFAPDGTLRRVIQMTRGSGPGEVRFPTAMDLADGQIAVFDYSLSRVTIFDTVGAVVQTITTPRAKDIALIGGYLLGSHMPGPRHAVWRIRLSDRARDDLYPVPDSSRRFNPRGLIARLAGYTGVLYVAWGEPGLWLRGADQTLQGRYALRSYDSTVWDGIAVPPGEPLAVIPLGASTAVAYKEYVAENRRPPSVTRQWLDLYDNDGRIVARGRLSDEDITTIAASHDGHYLYYASHDPYPRVIKARIEY